MYTPQNDKFDGYAQFPRPVVKPFQNQIDYHNSDIARRFHEKQRVSLGMVAKPVKKDELEDKLTG